MSWHMVSMAIVSGALCVFLAGCTQSVEGPAGTDSCAELADMYLATYQETIDVVEEANVNAPDGVDDAIDDERQYLIFNIINGAGILDLQSDVGLRWRELECEPKSMLNVLYDRVGELTYESAVGEYLVDTYSK